MSHRSQKERSEREGETGGRMVRARATLEVGEAATHLETLAQALRAGGVTIRRGQELAALRVGERAELKLEAGEEGGESVLKLEVRWETPQPEERLEITPGVEAAGGGQSGPPGGQAGQASQDGPSGPGGQGTQSGSGRRPGSQGRQGGQPSGEQASGSEGS
ncbi:amphi-Trp domain-containing protein [Deinococcus planocerae]|uniref:amphi-Trp domain-containing protein n=1 Tax=Deinococcus planocerae TaxID=1737569 RepID=UPI000C7F158A|nr:amphi-Trp domain-containing protein [Deinococcus planocerae]